MIEIWDYFMRRKGLLLAMLLTFSVSGMLSYRMLNHVPEPTPTYISVDDWGNTEAVEIPKTGGVQADQPFLAVMPPSQVAEIEVPLEPEGNDIADQPFNIVEQPEDLTESQVKTISVSNRADLSLADSIFLAIIGVIVLSLGSYLTYWHFRR